MVYFKVPSRLSSGDNVENHRKPILYSVTTTPTCTLKVSEEQWNIHDLSFMRELFMRILNFPTSCHNVRTPTVVFCFQIECSGHVAPHTHTHTRTQPKRLIAHVTSRRHQIKRDGKMKVKLLHHPRSLSEVDSHLLHFYQHYANILPSTAARFISPSQDTASSTISNPFYAKVLKI